ncbi:ABC transporter permease [Mycobacterium sp. 236(2023)]|uniref:ABC transporter permease n=1 Tax=Mycobacterium sp. 236(2023) TaxID=3038163 RepID=UPI00241594D1|nr:ABC transporter permease [Mycobacterium sp. 236(2023)]MDG4666730.1 ABC transporter permease [Mycobacterium sp. 236(2023)]
MPIDELRHLADSLRRIDAAAAAADWDDDAALFRAEAEARDELAALPGGDDIAAAAADSEPRTPEQFAANAVVAVGLARAAVAEAVIAVAAARRATAEASGAPARIAIAAGWGRRLRSLAAPVVEETRHLFADRPRAVLVRVVITLAIALALVTFYHVTGMTRYDGAGRLTLYLFSAVVGSVICTNALCFEAERVRAMLRRGEPLWRILIAKNLAMAAMVTLAGLPVIWFLTVTEDVNPVPMIDQLVTMVFIWLGVGNVLSVLYPLRHEPVSARLHDGTWKPFLLSFALSYGVGLTVNLMIYWRLWARYKASTELAGGAWAAFMLVLVSAMLSWILLTVFAVACSREPRIRRLLSREMVAYRKPQPPAG